MLYLQVFFHSLLFSLLVTPFFITYLINQRIVDVPDGNRKIHKNIIPRMGGLIVYISSILMFVIFIDDVDSVKLILIGSVVVLLCGILDDIIGLGSSAKFIFQTVASIFIFASVVLGLKNITIAGLIIPNVIAYLLLMLFLVGSINSVNMMDGLDGLVSGYSLIKFFVLLILAFKFNDTLLALFLISIIGSLIGFIKFNAFPAKIFLGDTGSLSLGYFLVWGILRSAKFYAGQESIDLVIPFMLLSAPNLDTVRVMIKRFLSRRNPFSADRGHLHHLLLDKNLKQKSVVFILHTFSTLYSLAAIVYMFYNKLNGFIFYLALLLIQLFLVDLISVLLNKKSINKISKKILVYSSAFNKLYKYFFLPITVFAVVFFIYSIFPSSLNIIHRYLYFILIFQLLLFAVAFYHNQKSGILHHIYVFFNVSQFLLVILWGSVSTDNILNSIFSNFSLIITISVVLVFTSAFVVFRNHFLDGKEIFLSGVDLLIIVSTFLINIMNQVVNLELLKFASISAILSFILYFWFKIVIVLLPKYEKPIYYLTYSLPFSLFFFLLN